MSEWARLAAENEKLKESERQLENERDFYIEQYEGLTKQRDELRAEVDGLRLANHHANGEIAILRMVSEECAELKAEVERLKKVVQDQVAYVGEAGTRAANYRAEIAQLRALLTQARDWLHANLNEMECRYDDNCDHCVGVQLLTAIDASGLLAKGLGVTERSEE